MQRSHKNVHVQKKYDVRREPRSLEHIQEAILLRRSPLHNAKSCARNVDIVRQSSDHCEIGGSAPRKDQSHSIEDWWFTAHQDTHQMESVWVQCRSLTD